MTQETHHLIGVRELALMQPGAVLIHTSRGGVVDEQALIAALQRGHLAGAGLDVFEPEPPDPTNPLLHMDNVICTPHAASHAAEALEEQHLTAIHQALAALAGRWPAHAVNRPHDARLVHSGTNIQPRQEETEHHAS